MKIEVILKIAYLSTVNLKNIFHTPESTMITTRFFSYLVFLSMAGGFWACTDHRVPAVSPGSVATRLRVKTLTLDLPNNVAKVSSFAYDAQGRLNSILTYQSPDSAASEVETSVYQYDGQNRLTQLRHEAVPYPRNSRPNRVEQYSYSYNGAGQVSNINYANGLSVSFRYNGANQLMSTTSSYTTGGLRISGAASFTFTGSNLTRQVNSIAIAGHGGPAYSAGGSYTTLTHDNKVNPFYGVYVIPSPYPNGFVNLQFGPGTPKAYFGGIDNMLTLSQNNVLTETPVSAGNESTVYQYQYNTANLPVVRIKTSIRPFPTDDLTTVETLRFAYESY